MRQPDLLKFFKYPDFVARAAELLGDKHYIFKQLKAKEQFFRARRVMLENLLGRSSLAESVQQRLLCNYCYEGLQYDSLAPYLYAMLGHGRCNNQRIQHYKKVLELSPTWLQAYIWMAEERESQGQMEEALDWIDQLFEMDSTYVLGHKKKSQLMVLLGKYKEAVIAGEEALELDTTYLDQWYNDWLASAYVMIHEYEKFRDYRRNQAEELESRATIERQIRGVQYLVDLANFQLEAGNLEKAKTLFTQTLSLTTNAELLERARWGLGWIALAEGQLNEAEIKFLELQGSERLSGLGFTYLKRNQLQLGDSILHLAISQHINQRNSPLEGAEQIILEGNTALAIAPVLAPEIVHLYQLALDSFPLHVSLSYNLGKVYQIQIQDFKKAVKQYEQTLRLEEQYLPAYYSMSTSFASMKKRKKALEWLELALKEGYDDQRKIQIEPAFDKIRKTKKFQSLIMQYF
jgi:tetratricopeptide (TPR) repeat protein